MVTQTSVETAFVAFSHAIRDSLLTVTSSFRVLYFKTLFQIHIEEDYLRMIRLSKNETIRSAQGTLILNVTS